MRYMRTVCKNAHNKNCWRSLALSGVLGVSTTMDQIDLKESLKKHLLLFDRPLFFISEDMLMFFLFKVLSIYWALSLVLLVVAYFDLVSDTHVWNATNLILSIGLTLYLVFTELRLEKSSLTVSEVSDEYFHLLLESKGWRLEHEGDFVYAQLPYGRLAHHLYVLIEGDKVFINVLCSGPFLLDKLQKNKILKVIKGYMDFVRRNDETPRNSENSLQDV